MQWGHEDHLAQTRSNACVAACAGMVLRRRGGDYDEAALMRAATDRGLDMRVAAENLGARFHGFLAPEALLGVLAMGSLAIVKVSGPAYVKRVGASPGGVASTHGDLASPGDYGAPIHALLIVGTDDERVRFFDPWYPADGQPFSMTREDLLAIYAGVAIEIAA